MRRLNGSIQRCLVLLVVLACRTSPPDQDKYPFSVTDVVSLEFVDRQVPLPYRAEVRARRPAVRVEQIEGWTSAGDAASRIIFSDSSTLIVPIAHAKLLMSIPDQQGADWILVGGAQCAACDAPPIIGIFRGTPGVVTRLGLSFYYPGELQEIGDEQPFFRSRMFVGVCVDHTTPVAVWLEDKLPPTTDTRGVARILRAYPRLNQIAVERTDAVTRYIEARVKSGDCREIAPFYEVAK